MVMEAASDATEQPWLKQGVACIDAGNNVQYLRTSSDDPAIEKLIPRWPTSQQLLLLA